MRSSLFAGALSALVLAASAAHAQDGPAPPPPLDPNQPGNPNAPQQPATQEQATQEDLNKSEKEDSGRSFELFWIDSTLGASYINMTGLNDSTLKLEKSSAAGPAFDLGLGVRFVVLVLGARLKYNILSAFNMWQLDGQIGLKFPISKLDVLIAGHGGYSFVGSLGDAPQATDTSTPTNKDDVKVRGFNAGLDFGIDYYLSSLFSIGAGGNVDFLFLNRPALPLPAAVASLPDSNPQKQAVVNDPLYKQSGSSVGFGFGGGLRLGLHFGL
ncbi:MAG TPA: hypothetical protein VIF62_12855 [Labilithrix sp.]|jgi:hypothetical protein